MREVKVEYTGSYPCSCMGNIIVYLDNKKEYETDSYVFHSTGSVWFDDEWGEHVEDGCLEWSNYEEKELFENWARQQPECKNILDEVESILNSVDVCCGGCI